MKPSAGALALLIPMLLAPALSCQKPEDEIQGLLRKVGAAYQRLTVFYAVVETTQAGETKESKVTTKLTFQKPGKLTAEIYSGLELSHVVADGSTIYCDSSRDRTTYTEQRVENFANVITALARSGGGGVGLLPNLLASPDPSKQIIPGKPSSLNKLPDETIDGVSCDAIAAVVGEGDRAKKLVLYFSKQDHLIRRLTVGLVSETKPRAIETYYVSLEPLLTEATFKYEPPAGAISAGAPKEPAAFDPRLNVGAIPLPIVGKDLQGEKVSLDDYKGKVLLLDFWATWCGPCVAELPNVIAAYNKYHEQGFEILGISLDETNARTKLEKFIADNKMPWRQIYDGGYWQAENAKGYGVNSIPFTLLIGRDGTIAAVGARGEALAPAVEAALRKQ